MRSSTFALSLDVDWAPDFMIQETIDILVHHELKATYFVTHDTPVLDTLRARSDLFELGIHPNFLAASSHGSSEREVFSTMKRLVPEARTMRSHDLVQGSRMLTMARTEFGITTDASLLLPGAVGLAPHEIRYNHSCPPLLRIPTFFEDDIEAYSPTKRWTIADQKFHVPGLKLFNFHPVYVYLNSDNMASYSEMKKMGPLSTLRPDQVVPFVNTETPGPRTLLLELCVYLSREKLKVRTLAEIATDYQREASV
jgi:hypothetical protein